MFSVDRKRRKKRYRPPLEALMYGPIILERRKSTQGRPRGKQYIKTADFLWNFEKLKCQLANLSVKNLEEYEKLKKEYVKQKNVIKALYRAQFKKVIASGTGVYRKGLIESVRFNVKGEFFKCPTCGAFCPGKEFTIDEKHKPPRIRIPLECGHWLDIFLKPTGRCPKCGGELEFDDEGFVFCVKCGWSQHEPVDEFKDEEFKGDEDEDEEFRIFGRV